MADNGTVRFEVSILTRPYGRMLCFCSDRCRVYTWFQSSPALTGGCYAKGTIVDRQIQRFNPHPPLRADAIPVDLFCGPDPDRFNPHPPLRADAIRPQAFRREPKRVSILTRPYGRMLWRHPRRQIAPGACFNPHPPLRADAIPAGERSINPITVSILTRPYGRMLCVGPHAFWDPVEVSILTRPYGRML